jgi:hypothetical protein
MKRRVLGLAAVVTFAINFAACGGDSDGGGGPDATTPTSVKFGDTVIVVVLNPVINDANDTTLPSPGTVRAGVTLTADDDTTATTDADGIAVLGPLTAGMRTITLSEQGLSGSFTISIGSGELREVAVAADSAQAQVMVNVDYKSDQITELTPSMTNQQVNQALSVSDTVVFFRGGSYTGNLDFSGSRVTMFGEGVRGGEVTLDGNVTVSGSDSRIRGATITGTLTMPASKVGLTFSRVNGDLSSEGSDSMFLANALCGQVTVTGSGSTAVDNSGASPIAANCP